MSKIQNSIIILFFSSLSVFSQERDVQSWYALSFNKKVIKKTELTFKLGLRLRENSSLYSKDFFDLKLKRKRNKRVLFAVGYRYAHNWDEKQRLSVSHRLYTDVNYKNKVIKRLTYSIRNRLQNQGDMSASIFTLRQKFSFQYNIRKTKLDPVLATEYFFRLTEGVNKLRSTISVSYPINKQFDFDLAYRVQQEFYTNNPKTLFIFEGRISYDL